MTARLDSAALEQALAQRRAAIDDVIATIAAGLTGEDPVSAAVRYALNAGGKRLRPILCLAAMDAAAPGGNASGATPSDASAHTPAQLRAACAVELVHTYSLVHDDLPCMDDDDLRRGRATAHRVFGTPAAMLAGFALVPHACRLLADSARDMGTTEAAALRSVRELCEGAGAAGMVGGQLLDLEAEHADVDRTALQRIHAMKTGALFRAALRVGGVLGGADAAGVAALGSFGDRLGLAFQITDDVLDVTMDAAVLGKTPGKDSDADKATFVSLLGVAGARRAAAAEAHAATDELRRAGLESPLLEALAGFAVNRDR